MPMFLLCLFAWWMFENQSSIKNHLNESENELFTVGLIDVWTFSNGLCSILSQFLNCSSNLSKSFRLKQSRNRLFLVFAGSLVASWERSSSTWTGRLFFSWEDRRRSRDSSPDSETPAHAHTNRHQLLLWLLGSLTVVIVQIGAVAANVCLPSSQFFLILLGFTLRTHQSHDVGPGLQQ